MSWPTVPIAEPRAVILVRPSRLAVDRQRAVCARHADIHHWRVVAVTDRAEDAVAMVRLDAAQVVVAAHDMPGDERLVRLVEDAGGTLVYVRAPRRAAPAGLDPAEVIGRLLDRGEPLAEIVRLLGVPVSMVQDMIRRRGRRDR